MPQERLEEWLGTVDATPTDAEIPDGKAAVYIKSSDGNLYKRPQSGSESQVGGGGGGSFTVVGNASFALASNETAVIKTGITTQDLEGGLWATVGVNPNATSGPPYGFQIGDAGATGGPTVRWDSERSMWTVNVENTSLDNMYYEVTVFRVAETGDTLPVDTFAPE